MDPNQKIILNFIPTRRGGGLQNAVSFVETVACDPVLRRSTVAVVRRGSCLEELAQAAGIESVVVGDGNVARLGFEMRARRLFARGQACFTIFGPPMAGTRGHLLNVAGCAYSNLFYPEIPFWAGLPARERMIREGVDVYRRHMTRQADYWILETEVLRRRAIDLCGFPPERVGVVRMAPSSAVSAERVDAAERERYNGSMPEGFRILFLTTPQAHKRLDRLPRIAAALRRSGRAKFVFVFTLPWAHPLTKELESAFAREDVGEHFHNAGAVAPGAVPALIDCCGLMGNLSTLESFSNNFVEAWKMGVPLMVTDAEWSRAACGEAGLYVNPEDAGACAAQVGTLMEREELRAQMVEAGRRQLASYPNNREKTAAYFDQIENARRLGPIPEAGRRGIRWPSGRGEGRFKPNLEVPDGHCPR